MKTMSNERILKRYGVVDESELFREYKPSLIYYIEDPENKVICKEVLSVHETGSKIIKF